MAAGISWEDIPSLEGVEVDWGYTPKTDLDKRLFARLSMRAMAQLLEVDEIPVKLATARQTISGTLVDISRGGVAVNLPVQLDQGTPVKLGFFLRQRKILCQGLVRHTRRQGDRFVAGIRFVDLAKDAAEYLGDLYAAKVLNRTA